jgi:hypothetical protein
MIADRRIGRVIDPVTLGGRNNVAGLSSMDGVFFLVPAFMAVIFVVMFATIFTSVAYQAATGFAVWSRNNSLPIEEGPARVVSKRSEVIGGGHTHHHTHRRVRTYYYETFEMKSGERLEFGLDGSEFGLLVEGDVGTLKHQGTRYHRFLRANSKISDSDF